MTTSRTNNYNILDGWGRRHTSFSKSVLKFKKRRVLEFMESEHVKTQLIDWKYVNNFVTSLSSSSCSVSIAIFLSAANQN